MEQCTRQMIIQLPIIKRDEVFVKLNNEILEKKRFLLEKREELEKQIKTNEFLESVKEDYRKFYNIILQQKREQYVALILLNKYIGNIRKSGELSKNNMEDAKIEQEKILEELNKIKSTIDGITEEVDINSP